MRILTALFFGFFCFSINAEINKIGFIDTEKIINNTSYYKKNLELLSLEFEPKKKELMDLFNHIELLRVKIDSNKKNLSLKNLKNEENKLYSLEESFKIETELWQTALNKRKIHLLQKIESLINETLIEFATEEDYDLIFYENIAYGSSKINITDQIIEKIEKKSL